MRSSAVDSLLLRQQPGSCCNTNPSSSSSLLLRLCAALACCPCVSLTSTMHCLLTANAATGIPEFWTTVLLKCDTTAELIKDKDLEVLKFLQDVQVRKSSTR